MLNTISAGVSTLLTTHFFSLRRSKQIQLAGTLNPTTKALELGGHPLRCKPYYSSSKFRLHPGFDRRGLCVRHGHMLAMLVWHKSLNEGASHDDFVTSPRCSVVAVGTGQAPELEQHCVVYVPTGVKMVDVGEAVAALESQALSSGVDYQHARFCAMIVTSETLLVSTAER